MSSDQRRALTATTPTTEVIKDAVTFPRERLGEPLDISPERFEAWLAGVKRDAAREALDGLAEHIDQDCQDEFINYVRPALEAALEVNP